MGADHPSNAKGHTRGVLASGLGRLEERMRPVMGLTSALLYGSLAVAMNFVNKFTMMVFPLPNVVILLQMVVTAVLLEWLLRARVLTFPPFHWARCRQLLAITFLYLANTLFALIALQTVNVPMYNVLKRLTPIIILAVKAAVQRKSPPWQVTGSVIVIVFGCVIAGLGDLTFEPWGYAMALASCLCQASYLLLVEFQGVAGISTSELLYYNAWSSLPLLAVLVVLTGDWSAAVPAATAAALQHGAFNVSATIACCCLMGCALNYALFLCTNHNSALTTTIVGVLKSVVAVGLGFFLLGGVPFSVVNVTGIALNMAGGIWYTWFRYYEKAASPTRAIIASASAAPFKDSGMSMEEVLVMRDGGGAGVVARSVSPRTTGFTQDEGMPLLPRTTARDSLMGRR
ncbi:hypothetical protein FOA52_001185 [Chlamydomonas sp. UWO 241]|nr:hypothetical protein FOA52_001185 [Chlamydomonas sp. UWO 241]